MNMRETFWEVGGASLTALCLSGLVVVGLAAQESLQEEDWGRGGWTLHGFAGQWNDEPEFRPDGINDQFRSDQMYGGRFGYVAPFNLFVETEVAFAKPLMSIPVGEMRTVNSFLYGASVGYNFQPLRRFQIFPVAGVGGITWDPDDLGRESETRVETELRISYGMGARFYLAPNLAVRADARMHHIPDALSSNLQRLQPEVPPGEDLFGLELSGGLTVFIGGPKEPEEVPVRRDPPPMPPPEPEPEPEPVEEEPEPEPVEPEVVAPLVLHNVYFDFDRAQIRSDAVRILDDIGAGLVERPELRIEVRGHADSVGSESYNLRLSQRRAEAVVDYLLENFPELERDMFIVEGYGESRPAATNATAEGRQQNRRVEFVIVDDGGSRR